MMGHSGGVLRSIASLRKLPGSVWKCTHVVVTTAEIVGGLHAVINHYSRIKSDSFVQSDDFSYFSVSTEPFFHTIDSNELLSFCSENDEFYQKTLSAAQFSRPMLSLSDGEGLGLYAAKLTAGRGTTSGIDSLNNNVLIFPTRQRLEEARDVSRIVCNLDEIN